MVKEKISPQKIESRARFAAERAYQLERFPKFRDYKEINKWKARAYRDYDTLAKYYENKIGGKKKAESYSRKAEKVAPASAKSLEGLAKAFSISSITFLAASLILIVFNLTGYAIGGMQDRLKLAGVISFLLGLLFTFLFLRAKKVN